MPTDSCHYEPSCTAPTPLYMGGITCTSSSVAGADYTCNKAIDGNGSSIEWVSQAEGVGAWILIDFHQDIALTSIGIMQKSNSGKISSLVIIHES